MNLNLNNKLCTRNSCKKIIYVSQCNLSEQISKKQIRWIFLLRDLCFCSIGISEVQTAWQKMKIK